MRVAVAVLLRWLVNLISSFGDDLFELGGLNGALFLTTLHWKSSRDIQPRLVPSVSSESFSDTASRDALPFSKCAHGGWSISPDFSDRYCTNLYGKYGCFLHRWKAWDLSYEWSTILVVSYRGIKETRFCFVLS